MSPSYTPRTTSETLLSVLTATGDSWSRSVHARFIREATDGTLRAEAFSRYLRIERDFVETSARVRAAAAFAAPTSYGFDIHRLAMNSLLDSQRQYLDEAIRCLGTDADIPSANWRRARMLSDCALRIAGTGDYARILVVMLAAEMLYKTWCSVALQVGAQRNSLLSEWIKLHAEPPFTDEVAQLTAELSNLQPDKSAVPDLAACAAEVLDLEVTFHDSAYLPHE